MGFLETPRYGMGYAVLFGTIGFVEHMLKPFQDRVKATHAFFEVLADWVRTCRGHCVRAGCRAGTRGRGKIAARSMGTFSAKGQP